MAGDIAISSLPPGMMQANRKRPIIRTRKNPLDKCTIVSIYPIPIDETKPTIFPGQFKLDAGSLEKPSILVVGVSSWWRDFALDQPIIEIPASSVEVAESVVKDYCHGMLGADSVGGSATPGLFYTEGEHTVDDIKKNYKAKLEETAVKQKNWFTILINIADSLWARSNNNPLVIWDVMRIAARELHFTEKPWLANAQIVERVACIFCGFLKEPKYPVCPSCHIIDPKHPLAEEALKLKNASQPFSGVTAGPNP